MKAEDVVKRTREQLRPVEEALRNHPYLKSVQVAEVVCGLLVNFAAWGGNCSQVGAGLRAKYGFTRDDTVFLNRFEAMPSFENRALEIIQDGL